MSSGFGVFTERGRCFPFWTDFMSCHDSSKYPARECKLQLEDYMECLHHTKEKERMIRIIKELQRVRRGGESEGSSV